MAQTGRLLHPAVIGVPHDGHAVILQNAKREHQVKHRLRVPQVHADEIIDSVNALGQGIPVDIQRCRRLADVLIAGKIGVQCAHQLGSVLPVIGLQLQHCGMAQLEQIHLGRAQFQTVINRIGIVVEQWAGTLQQQPHLQGLHGLLMPPERFRR